jgi:DNA-binding transcriptional LysR family regulator
MELRHLRYFLAVADAANFTRAAEVLGIGQPPLSQQIKALEQELDVELFKRTARGAELTLAGRVFADEARRVLADAERATRAAQRAARGETGHLRVGFTGTVAFNEHVAALIRRFHEAYPEAELSLQEGTSGTLLEAIEAGQLDVAIVRPVRRVADAIVQEDWRDEAMLVALPVAHRLASRKRIALEALADEPFVQVPRVAGGTLFDAGGGIARDLDRAGIDHAGAGAGRGVSAIGGARSRYACAAGDCIAQGGIVGRGAEFSGAGVRLQAAGSTSR